MSNEASVGLRVYLQDEISTGLAGIGDWVLELGKAFTDFGLTAGSSFNDVIDYTRLATQSLIDLNDVMLNLGASGSSVASGTASAATATEDLATASNNAATATKDAAISIDEMNVSIMQTNIDIDETTSKMGGMRESFMALMIGQQAVQSLDTAVQGAVISAGDLEDSFIRAQIATKATGDDIKVLDDAIVNLSDQGVFSTTQVADAFQLMGQRGYDTTQIVQEGLSNAILYLAEATKTDLVPTTDLVTTALRDFGASAKDSERYASALAYAAMNGIPDMTGLASALTRLGPSAAGLHIPFETVISALIFLSTHGMPDVSQAGTALNYMLQAMAAPTSTAAQMLQQIGVSFYDMQGNLKPLPDMIQELFTQLAKYPNSTVAADLRKLFNIRSGQGGRLLGNDPNIKQDLNNTEGNVKGAENMNYLQQIIDKLRGDFNQTLGRLQSTWNSTMALLLLPVVQWITPLLNNLNLFVTSITNGNPQVKTFVAILGGILLIVGPLALLGIGIALIVTVLGAAALPVGILVGALLLLAPLGALIATNWKQIQGFFAPLEPLFTNIGTLIKSSFAPALQQMKDGWNEIVQAVQPLLAQLKPLLPVFGAIGLTIVALVTGVLSGLGPLLGSIVHAIAGVLAGGINFFTGIIQFIKGVVQVIISIVQFLVGVLTGNKSLQNAAKKMFTEGLGNIVGGLMNMVKGAVGAIGAVLVGIFNGLIGFFGHFIAGVIGVFGTFLGGNGPVGIIQKTVDNIINIVSGFPAQVMTWITNLVNGVVNWFKHLADVLYGHSIVPDMVNALLGLFGNLVSRGVALIGNLVHGILTWFGSLPGNAGKLIGDMLSAIGSGISKGAGFLGGLVHDHIVTPIQNAIHNLINMALSWGSNFINMLKQGILNGISAIMGAVQNVANGIKHMLGFHSPPAGGPLADSDQYMPNMMTMMAGGILSHAHLIHGAVNHVASGIQSGITSPTIARLQQANVAGANGQNTTVNLNVDGKTVGTAVFNHLTGQMQLNGLNRSWR